eukprot:scaffold16437_cov64-Isochrysis_galbana.AAC.2
MLRAVLSPASSGARRLCGRGRVVELVLRSVPARFRVQLSRTMSKVWGRKGSGCRAAWREGGRARVRGGERIAACRACAPGGWRAVGGRGCDVGDWCAGVRAWVAWPAAGTGSVQAEPEPRGVGQVSLAWAGDISAATSSFGVGSECVWEGWVLCALACLPSTEFVSMVPNARAKADSTGPWPPLSCGRCPAPDRAAASPRDAGADSLGPLGQSLDATSAAVSSRRGAASLLTPPAAPASCRPASACSCRRGAWA